MASNQSSVITTAVSLIREISPPLHYDLIGDTDDVISDIKRSLIGEPPIADFDDHLKSAVRSLFGEIEAVTHCLTTAVLQYSASGSFALTNADRSVLEELDYNEGLDSISSQARRYPLARRFEVSSRVFLRACGVRPAPPWDVETIHHFRTLTRARNALTHPARLEDLIAAPCFEAFRHMATWFPAQVIYILASASEAFGIPRPSTPTAFTFPPLTSSLLKPKDVFDDAFYKMVFSEPAIAIRYISLFSQRLDDELSRAFDLCRSFLSPPYDPPRAGRAIRRMVRAITTNVEGTIGFTSFFMRAVRLAGAKIAIPQPPKDESVPDRIVRVLTTFSMAFGNDITPSRNEAWNSLVLTFEMRDRLTHPRILRDVTLTASDLDAPLESLDWLFGPAHEAVLLSQEKIARAIGASRTKNPR